jgi:hypothetical protein
MTGSRELHRLFGLEPGGPAQLRPGEIDVSIDGAWRVVLTLTIDAGSFEVTMEPCHAYRLGFGLIDAALRACGGAWPGGR